MGNKELNIGDVVYFIETRGYDCDIKYGIISDIGAHKVWIDFLVRADKYGIYTDKFYPIEFDKWYNPDHFTTYLSEIRVVRSVSTKDAERLQSVTIDDPKGIKRLYEDGILTTRDKVPQYDIEVVWSDKYHTQVMFKANPLAWTLIYNQDQRISTCIPKSEVLTTYEEALENKQFVQSLHIEGITLSDYDWSVREIEKILRRFAKEKAEQYRKILLAMPDVEDLEVRKFDDKLQYRYFSKKTKWQDLEIPF